VEEIETVLYDSMTVCFEPQYRINFEWW